MSSDIRSQILDSCEEDSRKSSSINKTESEVNKKSISKPEDTSQRTYENLNHTSSIDEYEYDDLSADYHLKTGVSKTMYYGNDQNVKSLYKALIKDQEHYKYILHRRVDKERIEGLKIFKDTFPQDPAVQRSWVKKIFDAILDLDSIIDKKTKYHNNSSQAARRIQDGYYPDLEIEKTAWKLMLNARDAQIGIRLVEKYHGIKVESPVLDGVGVFETWADRMDAIINTLRVSKAACKQLMDPHYLDRLVECPNSERQMKKNNKRINTERDIQNQLGRKLLDLKVVPVADVEREAKKLKDIKEEHRLSAPPKTPRIKKERLYEDSPSIPSSAESLGIHKSLPHGQKRKRTLRHKNFPYHQKRVAGSNLTNRERVLSEQFQSRSFLERQQSNRVYTDPSTPVGLSTGIEMAVENDMSITDGIYVQRKFHNSLAATVDPFVSEASLFNTNRKEQNIDGYQNNRNIFFQFDQCINTLPAVSSFQLDSLGGSVNSSQPDILTQSKYYSEIICNLLEIKTDYSILFNLADLRLYARAYNAALVPCPWTHPDIRPYMAKGCCVYDHTGQSNHITRYFPKFICIAIERGDIDERYRMIPGTDYQHLFTTNGDKVMDEALGVIENPCGLCQLSPPTSY